MKKCFHDPTFFNKFTDFIDNKLLLSRFDFVLLGGLNFHMEVASDGYASRLRSLLLSSRLTQHVGEVTHQRGHLLEVVIAHSNTDLINLLSVHDAGISDHEAVHSRLSIGKHGKMRSTVTSRQMTVFNMK